jgi:hypothetical protein
LADDVRNWGWNGIRGEAAVFGDKVTGIFSLERINVNFDGLYYERMIYVVRNLKTFPTGTSSPVLKISSDPSCPRTLSCKLHPSFPPPQARRVSSSLTTMNAPFFPSILISCPCSDNVGQQRSRRSKTAAADPDLDQWEEEGETFDPRSPRSAFSLFPLENLLFCEDCNQVRCPRCVQDEIACYFCPSCLFEVPSSTVKSEGNRYVCLHPERAPPHESYPRATPAPPSYS